MELSSKATAKGVTKYMAESVKLYIILIFFPQNIQA